MSTSRPPFRWSPRPGGFRSWAEASYRGYFSEKAARRYADIWEKKGWDVYVDGVDAYSTLGWFRDPLMNTFIFEPEADLAELIFHELAHRRLFVHGDTDFNEAFATEVAAEGLRRWFAASSNPRRTKNTRLTEGVRGSLCDLVMDTRQELEAVYGDTQFAGRGKTEA